MEKEIPRKSKAKRLTDHVKQRPPSSYVPTHHLPQMSETALKRWYEARDTYLGHRKLPVVLRPRRIKPKKDKQSAPIIPLEPEPSPKIEIPIEQPQLPEEHQHLDDKCVGTDIDQSILVNLEIEQIDEAIQADLPSPPVESQPEEISIDQEVIEYDDKATETELIFDIEKDENEIDRPSSEEIIIDSNPIVDEPVEPINDEETKSILSKHKSDLSIHEQLRRLRHRFKRSSKERRLIICLLLLYLIIMLALLIVILLLLWAFQERSLVLTQEVKLVNPGMIDGVARYGESCRNDNDCKRPSTCFKKKPSSSGNCRCPIQYDFVNNQCIGDLNARCTKDTECQRYMLCSGINDGTRRCLCQTSYIYDNDRRQCRGDYRAPCQSPTDCHANLICNKTMNPSLCLCTVNYRYSPLEHKCRGDPGARCEKATAECAENAECRDGVCECAFQYIPNEKKICVDPCPKSASNRVKIRYPGDCRRFIDCQQRTKNECPHPTVFNFRTQLCDYRKNVFDCP